jgi:RNA polymerase sigma-70 factor (sigma-E family)
MGKRPDFDDFVAARSTRLLRTAYVLTGDQALAEDLLQAALTKAWFAWNRIAGDPEPYVRKVLVNTYVSWWRRRWSRERPVGRLRGTVAPDRVGTSDSPHDLWEAIDRLPRRQRAVVVLRYLEDLSEVEAARLLECSVGTVRRQVDKAVASLRIDPAPEPVTSERSLR